MSKGHVALVGAGPGDPELLTLKAVKALAQAEIVVHDRLVSDAVLKVAPDSAMRISVGKEAGRHSYKQEEINGLLVHLALQGKNIVRLKGGDPFVFGRACEEIEALEAHGISWSVVPGITAAQGCAASARVPLTHRGLARSLRFVTGHCRGDQPLELDWRGLADPQTTVAFYMGAATAPQLSARLIENGLPPETPALCISQGTTPQEQRVFTSLDRLTADLDRASLPSPILIIVGAAMGWRPNEPSGEHSDDARLAPVEADRRDLRDKRARR
ncbi:MAG: uroporphyrinogen-III C-methyltransferase [Methylobacteriaceae bacterium]|nr:uroporphyrinogen-III C-methyltransferase [Methylobacteriaceae bacterium]